jgi:hypothetical protein
MERYLQHRTGWTMMVLKNNILKTVRFEKIVEHMRRVEGDKYFLVAPYYAGHFRKRHIEI